MSQKQQAKYLKWDAGICTKCGRRELVRRDKNPDQSRHGKRAWYYTTVWWCSGCGTVFLDNRYKVMRGNDKPDVCPTLTVQEDNCLTLVSDDAPEVEVWTDGACLPTNPGPGGWGVILRSNGTRQEIAGPSGGETTNNRMELMGPIQALESLTKPCIVRLHSDSLYVVDGMNRGLARWRKTDKWRLGATPNQDLWERLSATAARHRVTWIWVKGHSGQPLNERADELANEAALTQQAFKSRFRERV